MKLADRIRAHPAVDTLHDEREYHRGKHVGGGWFCYLNPGWEWSEQTCFGDEELSKIWSLVKEAKKIQTT